MSRRLSRKLQESPARVMTAAPGLSRSGGRPLPDQARARLEPRLGHDFSRVRIHSDSQADQAARSMGARAFTLRDDIYYSRAAPPPGTPSGDHLLAHELAHVAQGVPGMSPEDETEQREAVEAEPVEREAEDSASRATEGVKERGGGIANEAEPMTATCSPDTNRLPVGYRRTITLKDGTDPFCASKGTISVMHASSWLPAWGKTEGSFTAQIMDIHSKWKGETQTWSVDPTETTDNFKTNGPGDYWIELKFPGQNPDSKKRHNIFVRGEISEP